MEIICLANSRKRAGRCVAGLRVDGGGWVRPVSGQGDGTLYYPTYTLARRGYAQLLDVIRISVTSPRPQPNQPENWLLDHRGWILVARPAGPEVRRVLKAALCRGPALLGGEGDRMPMARLEAEPAAASLALVAPREVAWTLQEAPSGERRVRAQFALRGSCYSLWVTDPLWEERFRRLPPGTHATTDLGLSPSDRLLLTISLGEPYNGECYKLVAGVVVVPPEWRRPR